MRWGVENVNRVCVGEGTWIDQPYVGMFVSILIAVDSNVEQYFNELY
jgi:hypothetical protein